MKIKIKYLRDECKLEKIDKGDWIDLHSSLNVKINPPTVNAEGKVKFTVKKIPLGFALELPPGMEAVVVSRSSNYNHYRIVMTNGEAVIDCVYNGDEDEWQYQALMLGDSLIKKGDRIAQFRIQPSQFATPWQKLKWLFTKKIEFVEVDHLEGKSRGGFGTTGKK